MELLVVISIIALLVSILMPALNTARGNAKKVVCSTNQRGIGQAYLLYATENDDLLIPIRSAQPFFMTNRTGFGGWEENRNYFEPYTTPEQFYCPAMGKGLGGVTNPNTDLGSRVVGWSVRPIDDKGDYYVAIGFSMLAGWGRGNNRLKYLPSATYGHLDSLAENPEEHPLKLTQIKIPATAPLLTDIAVTRWPSDPLNIVAETYLWVPYEVNQANTNAALNHISGGGRISGINTAYGDGHVKWNMNDKIFPRAWYTFQEYVFWY